MREPTSDPFFLFTRQEGRKKRLHNPHQQRWAFWLLQVIGPEASPLTSSSPSRAFGDPELAPELFERGSLPKSTLSNHSS